MDLNGIKPQPPDLSNYEAGFNSIPSEVLKQYAGKHVAISPDGRRVLASGNDPEEVDRQLAADGIHLSQVVHDYIDEPDGLIG